MNITSNGWTDWIASLDVRQCDVKKKYIFLKLDRDVILGLRFCGKTFGREIRTLSPGVIKSTGGTNLMRQAVELSFTEWNIRLHIRCNAFCRIKFTIRRKYSWKWNSVWVRVDRLLNAHVNVWLLPSTHWVLNPRRQKIEKNRQRPQ